MCARWAGRLCSRSRSLRCRSTGAARHDSADSSRRRIRCAQRAGIPVAGVAPRRLGQSRFTVSKSPSAWSIRARSKRNAGEARRQDHSRKALGVGVYGAAQEATDHASRRYREMIASTTSTQRHPGPAARSASRVHALTDVTGFGLLGHLLECAKAPESTPRCAGMLCRLLTAARARRRGTRHRRLEPQLERIRWHGPPGRSMAISSARS